MTALDPAGSELRVDRGAGLRNLAVGSLSISRMRSNEKAHRSQPFLHRSDDVPILYPGKVHSFIGEPESMKSWGWQVAAAQLLKEGSPVLVLDFENDEYDVIERLRALGVTDDQMVANLYYIPPDEPLIEGVMESLVALIGDHKIPLVVIDGVTDAMATLGFDADKSNTHAASFDRKLLKPLARAGPAVVTVDHVTKERDGRGRYAIGAQHKLAAISGAAFIFERKQHFGRGRDGVAHVTLSKDKPGWLRREAGGNVIAVLRLKSDPDSGQVTGGFEPPREGDAGDAAGVQPTALMQDVYRHLEENPGLSKNGIINGVCGQKARKSYAVELLVRAGNVRTEPGRRGGRLHYAAKPLEGAGSDAASPDIDFWSCPDTGLKEGQ
jgi:hypothetical protein